MTGFLMDTTNSSGKKVFSKAGLEFDIISWKYINRMIEVSEGVKKNISLKIVMFEELEDGVILEIDYKIYRTILPTKSMNGSYSYMLEQIRN